MPEPEEHSITVDDRESLGVDLNCQCGWEQHAPSMRVADLLAAEHRASPEYAEKTWAL